MMIEQNRRCAINYLNELKANTNGYVVKWLDIAIKALEQQPNDDCKSWQAIASAFKDLGLGDEENGADEYMEGLWDCYNAIKSLPPVQPQIPIGKWLETSLTQVSGGDFNRGFKCSSCDYVVVVDDFNYCPNCGAKMEVDMGEV